MRARSIFANLSFAVTVGIATYLTANRFDRDACRRDAEVGGALRSRLAPGSYRLSRIPIAKWLLILSRTFLSIRNDRIVSVAAGVTFYGLLALFPTIAAVLSLYGLIAESRHLTELLAAVDGALPTAGVEFLRNRIDRIDNNQEAKLSFALFVSVVFSLWSANRGMKALFEGLNVAYGEIERRTIIQLNTTSTIFTIGLLFFLVVAVFCVVTVPLMFNSNSNDIEGVFLLWIGRWPALYIMVLVGLELLYRNGPSRTSNQWEYISPGALLASLIWMLGSFIFSIFWEYFQGYNRTFGTLAAVDILLFWMWLSSICILIGAEFNGVGERCWEE